MNSGTTTRTVRGFTLIELLVVVGIIAILIALSTPGIMRAMEKARIYRARITAVKIANAVKTYTVEKSAFPLQDFDSQNMDGMPDSYSYNFGGSGGFSNLNYSGLCEAIEPYMKAADIDIGSSGRILDPWEQEYIVVVDGNFDGIIQTVNRTHDIIGGSLKDRESMLKNDDTVYSGISIFVYSFGPNKKDHNGRNNQADDEYLLSTINDPELDDVGGYSSLYMTGRGIKYKITMRDDPYMYTNDYQVKSYKIELWTKDLNTNYYNKAEDKDLPKYGDADFIFYMETPW